MEKQLLQIREFHDSKGIPYHESPSTEVSEKYRNGLIKMMGEELQEIYSSMQQNDLVNLSKEFSDLLYMLLGGVDMYGMSGVFPDIFNDVHASNMSKSKSDAKLNLPDVGGWAEKSNGYKKVNLQKYFQ